MRGITKMKTMDRKVQKHKTDPEFKVQGHREVGALSSLCFVQSVTLTETLKFHDSLLKAHTDGQ